MNSNSLSINMPALNEEKNISDAIFNSLKAIEFYNINAELMINHEKPMGIGFIYQAELLIILIKARLSTCRSTKLFTS